MLCFYYTALRNEWELPQTCAFLSFESVRARYLAEVLKFRDEEWRIYFTNPAYLDLVEKCFGQAERRNVAEMGRDKHRIVYSLIENVKRFRR